MSTQTKNSRKKRNRRKKNAEKTKNKISPEIQQMVDSKIAQLTFEKERIDGPSAKKAEIEFAKQCRESEDTFKALLEQLTDADEKTGEDLLAMFKSQVGKSTQLEQARQTVEHRMRQLASEKISVTVELRRMQKLKDNYEALCQSLQDKNVALVEQHKRALESEGESRQEMIKRFDESFRDISAKIEEHSAESTLQAEQNNKLREDLAKCLEVDELRQKEYKKLHEARVMDRGIYDEQKKKYAEIIEAQDREINDLRVQLERSLVKEIEQQKQIDSYVEKFNEVQDSLAQSSEVFEQFKKANDDLAKRRKEVDRSEMEFRAKSKKMDLALLELMKERNAVLEQNKKLINQKESLSGLCRRLQDQTRLQKQKTSKLEIQLSCVRSEQTDSANEVDSYHDSGANSDCEVGSRNVDYEKSIPNEFNEVD